MLAVPVVVVAEPIVSSVGGKVTGPVTAPTRARVWQGEVPGVEEGSEVVEVLQVGAHWGMEGPRGGRVLEGLLPLGLATSVGSLAIGLAHALTECCSTISVLHSGSHEA